MLWLHKKKKKKYFIIIYWLIFNLFHNLTAEAKKICLLAPYINSISDFKLERLSGSRYKLNIDAQLDYNIDIRIKDIEIDFLASKIWEKFYVELIEDRKQLSNNNKRIDKSQIIYFQDFVRNERKKFTKELYLNEWRNFYRTNFQNSFAPADLLAQICSPIYIYDSDYIETFDNLPDKYLHFLYFKHFECYKENIPNNQYPGFAMNNQIYLLMNRDNPIPKTISSSLKRNDIQVSILSDGEVVFKRGGGGGEMRSIYLFDFGLFEKDVTGNDRNTPILYNSYCYSHYENLLNKIPFSVKQDALLLKPLNSITQLTPNFFLGVIPKKGGYVYSLEEDDKSSQSNFLKSGDERFSQKHYDEFNRLTNLTLENFSLEAMSAIQERPGIDEYKFWLIFVDYSKIRTYLFTFYSDFKLTKFINMHNYDVLNTFVVPDDILHWTTCKKIISIYGLLYTMHNYDQNILRTPSQWLEFEEEELFDYRIEAASADGDEFMFLTKFTTLIKIKADSSDCNRLQFIKDSKRLLHYRQLFVNRSMVPTNNDSTNQFLFEGRYYDIDEAHWIPRWPFEEAGLNNNNNLLYIIIGVILVLITLIVIIFFIYRFISKQDQQIVIYSQTSRSSLPSVYLQQEQHHQQQQSFEPANTIRSPLTRSFNQPSPQTKKKILAEQASVMPLFSEQVSNFKSKSSVTTKSKSKSPRTKKSKRATAKPQQSKKSSPAAKKNAPTSPKSPKQLNLI